MKVVFQRTQLIEVLTPMMSTVSNKTTIPELEGVLIEAIEGKCLFTTFDSEKGMRRELEAEVEEIGSVIINASRLLGILRAMEGDYISMDVDAELRVKMQCGKSVHSLIALKSELFPKIPMFITEDGMVVNQSSLKKMIGKTSFAMGNDDNRIQLNGTFFRVTDNRILCVTCDGSQIAKCSCEADIIKTENNREETLDYKFIVPASTINELYKFLKDDVRENVTVYKTERHIIYHFNNMILFSKLIEQRYIEYDRFITTTHKIFVTLKRSELISALERAALITEDKVMGRLKNYVTLSVENGVMTVTAKATLASSYDELAVEQEGDNITIAFRNRFLIQALHAGDSEKIRLSLTSSLTGMNVEPSELAEGEEEIYMILPVKVKD